MMQNRRAKPRRVSFSEHRPLLPGALLLVLSFLLANCSQLQTQPLAEEWAAAPATTTPSNLMLTDPTTVDLASGRTTFVWFFAAY